MRTIAVSIALMAILLFAFNNCSNPIGQSISSSAKFGSICSTQSVKSPTSMKASLSMPRESPFAHSKVLVPKSSGAFKTQASSQSDYVALVSNNCLKNEDNFARASVSREVAILNDPNINNDLWVYKVKASDFNPNDAVQVASAEQDPCLIGISVNQIYHRNFIAADLTDSLYTAQAHLSALSQQDSIPYFYHLTYGIKDPGAGTPLVKVGVIDTGANYNHPDLKDNMFRGVNGYGVDASTLGRTDIEPVYDGIDVDTQISHGTHVSGIIAGRGGNTQGISGVAPFGIKVVPIKVFFKDDPADTDVYSDTETVTKGILWAVQEKLDVINMSLGGNGTDPALEAALLQAVDAGIFVAAAAGNASSTVPAQELNDGFKVYPAYYASDIDGMMAVGSVDTEGGGKSYFSHYGKVHVEIAAYGSESNTKGILSTFGTNSYDRLQGTSQATPQVAAAAALVMALVEQNGLPKPSPADVERILQNSAKKVSTLTAYFKDGNVLNLENLGKVVNQTYPQTMGMTSTPASCR